MDVVSNARRCIGFGVGGQSESCGRWTAPPMNRGVTVHVPIKVTSRGYPYLDLERRPKTGRSVGLQDKELHLHLSAPAI